MAKLVGYLSVNVKCPGCGWILAWMDDNENLSQCRGKSDCKYYQRKFKTPQIPIELEEEQWLRRKKTI